LAEIPDELNKVAHFHGHLCPGLALGYRVAILARKEFNLRSEDEELVAIVENDSCAVDAIQFLNGATFGKGNLIFQDHGLHAYTFFERHSGKQIRVELKADIFNDSTKQRHELMQKVSENIPLSDEEKAILSKSRQEFMKKILSMTDKELFNVKKVHIEVPEKARVFQSVKCASCGLMVMETRVRVFNQSFYCIPCWENKLGKKIN
jgi:formylmethanofuran dehydrogenase subunit E